MKKLLLVFCLVLTALPVHSKKLNWGMDLSIIKNMSSKSEKALAKDATNSKKVTIKHGKDHTIYEDKNVVCFYSVQTEKEGAERLQLVCHGSATMLIQTTCIRIPNFPIVRSLGSYTFIDKENDISLIFSVHCNI